MMGEGVASAFDPVTKSWALHGGPFYLDSGSEFSDGFCELRIAED